MTETGTLEDALKRFGDSIACFTKNEGRYLTPIPGFGLFNRKETTPPLSVLYEPCICMIAQGEKRVIQGTDTFTYDPSSYLMTSVHLPTLASVSNASPEKPCLGIRLDFDLKAVAQLMSEYELPAPRASGSERSMATGTVTLPLLDAFQRLLNLLEHPEDIPVLAPIIIKEIHYRLLVGDQGNRLRQIASSGTKSHQISKAIRWLKQNYSQTLRVDDMAQELGMSISTFHHHFRAMTNLSPLQYQKQLRLQEARSLMLAENQDAATAAFNVGYESPSQFSREYSRHFGAPPIRDINHLREMALSA